MLIGGSDVGQVRDEQRPDVPCDQLFVEALCLVRAIHEENEARGKRHGREGCPGSRKREACKAACPVAERDGAALCKGVLRSILGCYGGKDPPPKSTRSTKAQGIAFEKLLLTQDFAMGGRASAAALQMTLHRERIGRIELAIGKTMQKQIALRARAGHVVHGSTSFQGCISEPF